MQSSTAIAFRALVMLICMISIPLFAIFGRDLPEVIKNLLAGRLVVSVTDASPSNRAAAAGSATAVNGNLPARATSPFSEPTSYRAEGGTSAPAAAHPAAPAQASSSAGAAQPAGFQAPSESRPISPSELASRDTASAGSLNNQQASDAPRVPSAGVTATPASAAGGGSGNEQFRKAEARLRELGATHYTLETWGSDNNRYRFVCKMAVGGNPAVNRYFQAIEDDPQRAMEAVLQQVETWRAQQPQ